jgi:hypothetical protein
MKVKIILSIITLNFLFIQCKKECEFIKLHPPFCESGYSIVSGEKYIESFTAYARSEPLIINTDSAYHAYFNQYQWLLPNAFGPIDFSIYSLVGANIYTKNEGGDIETNAWLCKKNDSDNWVFSAEYSLKDKCKGSGITSMYYASWLITPKIPDSANVKLKIIEAW